MRDGLPDKWVEVELEEILLFLESGKRPKGGVRGIKVGIPSLGGEHLNSNGGFNFENIKYVPFDFYNQMNKGHIEQGIF
jgi:type I restriction enzyme S subunit